MMLNKEIDSPNDEEMQFSFYDESGVLSQEDASDLFVGNLIKDNDDENTWATYALKKRNAQYLFFAAIAIFACAVSMCMILLVKSSEVAPLPPIVNVQPIKYVVNMEQPAKELDMSEYTPPTSKYDSNLLNFLVLCVNENKSETFMMLSVHRDTKQIALMSLPRDTYVYGNYEVPMLRNVYSESADTGRGVQALQEKIKDQIGFWPDYYMVLDEAALEEIFEITGDIEFEVPKYPNYSGVDAGMNKVGSWSALKLFSCQNNYSIVETESSQVQRDLLLTVIAALTQRSENVQEDMKALKAAMDTNMSMENLAYMLYFFKGVDFSKVTSICLPGEVIAVEGKEYFSVDPQGACDILNSYFNPMKTELSIYNVVFRQQAGDSGEGEYEEFHRYLVTSSNNKPTSKPTERPTEPPVVTEVPTPPTMPDGPDTPNP